MDLHKALEDVKHLINNGSDHLKNEGFSWLNGICLELIKICKFIHKFLIFETQSYGHTIETVLLCLTQLISCIRYLEKTIKIEQQELVELQLTHQHFLDRMQWCLTQLQNILNADDGSKTPNAATTNDNEGNFVTYMDVAFDTLTPLVLYSSDENPEQNTKTLLNYLHESKNVRHIIELLMEEAMAFVNVALERDKVPLKALCQKVMNDCVAFQEECNLHESNENINEQDIRLKAQLLENSLYNLDRLMNHSLLRMVYVVFADLNQNPLANLRDMSKLPESTEIDDEIENFDLILDRMMQIGSFATAYASKAKLKVSIRSCLASCEALDSCLIPSIFSSNAGHHSKILESHWYEEITNFKRLVQGVIDTNVFCLNLIDVFDETLKKFAKNVNCNQIERILQQCDVLCEHFKCNYMELGLDKESKARLYYDDFRLMLSECKAAIDKKNSIDKTRILKRFKILLSVLKKLEASLDVQETVNKNNERGKSFTFGEVTLPKRTNVTSPNVIKVTDSLEVLIDFDEFITPRENIHPIPSTSPSPKFVTSFRRNSVFYESTRQRTFRRQKSYSKSPNLKKDVTAPKRASKRNSLRVAMFKRQKSIETQRFFESLSGSKDPSDSLNLQITDILDELTDLSSSFSN